MNIAQTDTFPLPRKGISIPPLGKPLIQQQDDASVLLRPDHPSRRLLYLIHARIYVSIIKSIDPSIVKILLQKLPLPAHLGKPGSYDNRADQPVICKVDPF